jgi:hypothetical protein
MAGDPYNGPIPKFDILDRPGEPAFQQITSKVRFTEPENVLEEANRLIHSERNASYGHPLDDFSAQAQMWSAYLSKKYRSDIALDFMDVAMMMVMVKVARQATLRKRDNLTDICGYAGCAEMCEIEESIRTS